MQLALAAQASRGDALLVELEWHCRSPALAGELHPARGKAALLSAMAGRGNPRAELGPPRRLRGAGAPPARDGDALGADPRGIAHCSRTAGDRTRGRLGQSACEAESCPWSCRRSPHRPGRAGGGLVSFRRRTSSRPNSRALATASPAARCRCRDAIVAKDPIALLESLPPVVVRAKALVRLRDRPGSRWLFGRSTDDPVGEPYEVGGLAKAPSSLVCIGPGLDPGRSEPSWRSN